MFESDHDRVAMFLDREPEPVRHGRVFTPEHGYSDNLCFCGRQFKSDRGRSLHIKVESEKSEPKES